MNLCQIRHEMETQWTRYGGIRNRMMQSLYLALPEKRRRARGREQFDSYFKFGFVRNPWDRVVSLYERREGLQFRDQMDFEGFVDWIRYSSSTSVHAVPHRYQLDWFVDPHGDLLADLIGKFEKLSEDWASVAERIGLPTELPHTNPGVQRKHYSEYYSNRTRHVVAERFAVDIEYFGYEFEG